MRQKIRRLLVYTSLLLFPLTLNYFSPYVSIDGAILGLVSGSVLAFGLMFLSGLIFGRVWCGWLCPGAGFGELASSINDRILSPRGVRILRILRYGLFALWFSVLAGGFLAAGGIRGVDPFHLTEQVVSMDEPLKFVIYYMVILVIFGLDLWIGRRGFCHASCWMSPFLTGGTALGRLLHLPQLQVRSHPEACIDCRKCNRSCPMSIDVHEGLQAGAICSLDCILCGACQDVCPKEVLKLGFRR